MKIRLGFVSNSSSDSYLIATTVKLKDFKIWLEGIFKAYTAPLDQADMETVSDGFFEKSFDDAMTVSEGNPKEFRKSVKEFYGSSYSQYSRYEEHMDEIERMEKDAKELAESNKQKGVVHFIRIDSTTDNSIPYGVQQAIEDRFFHHIRMHWG